MSQPTVHWDDENTHHILVEHAERLISKAEVEEVLCSSETVRWLSRRGNGRFMALGKTAAGRELVVVYMGIHDMRPITARPLGRRERRYQR